jgi:hypothetical protein
MKNCIVILALIIFGTSCAKMNVRNALEIDRNDPKFIAKLSGKTPSEVEKIIGESVFKGHPMRGDEVDSQTYKLVYVEKGQAPIYEWQLRLRVSNNAKTNTDTGVKCVAVVFSSDNGFKFVNGGAAIDWNYDCISYRDLKGDSPN